MTENSTENETLPCGHTLAEHLLQRVELGREMTSLAGMVIPEDEQPRYDVLALLVYVTNGDAGDNTYTALADITMALAEKAFPESEDIVTDIANTVVQASNAAKARAEAEAAEVAKV